MTFFWNKKLVRFYLNKNAKELFYKQNTKKYQITTYDSKKVD